MATLKLSSLAVLLACLQPDLQRERLRAPQGICSVTAQGRCPRIDSLIRATHSQRQSEIQPCTGIPSMHASIPRERCLPQWQVTAPPQGIRPRTLSTRQMSQTRSVTMSYLLLPSLLSRQTTSKDQSSRHHRACMMEEETTRRCQSTHTHVLTHQPRCTHRYHLTGAQSLWARRRPTT